MEIRTFGMRTNLYFFDASFKLYGDVMITAAEKSACPKIAPRKPCLGEDIEVSNFLK